AKAFNDKVSAAALRYHIKAALNKSHSIESFKQNLNKIANRVEFNNATKALLREIEQALPRSTESGGGGVSTELKPNREVSTTPNTESGTTQANIEARALQSEAAEVGQQEARALESSKVKGASEAPVNEARALQSEAPVNARGLRNETAEVGQNTKALESEADVRALESQTPVKVQDEAGQSGGSETLPTKTKLERELSPQEIHEVISKWDLSPTSNKSGKQRLVVARVEAKEAEELTKALEFKGQKDLIREIDSHQVIHALKQHGDIAKEAQRGQIAINLEDISHYIDTIKEADFKHIQDNGRVLYAKQVNGHVVVIEEALSGQDKLRFFDMWKQKGKLNKEVLLSHSQRPNTTPSLNLEGHMPSNSGYSPKLPTATKETTTPPLKSQAIPHNKAFGTNFEQFYHDPKGAIAKLLETKEGQVAGAFYREDLGDIDLVWGEIRDQKGKLQGYGLSKIVEKHLNDFSLFEGNSAYEKLGNGLEEIVRNGKLVSNQAGVKTIILKKDKQEFRVGLTQGWKHEGDNYWIVTAYKKSPAQKFDQVAAKSEHGTDLVQKDKPNPTTPPLKSQEFNNYNNYIDVEVIQHPKLLPYKGDWQIYKEAKAKGLSYIEFKALREQEKATRAQNNTR
ncbi:RNA polymerase-binding protein DksA, partial [Helicobacter suis]|uniref:putative barnase/colicin E5 family endoribonuclease n=1 Tax=Helicobacter suis TaxID=104628 RepID=UPI0013D05DE7